MSKKRVLSAIQPTGDLHIGNYFGAIRNWVELQDGHECIYGVVDLHAMTMPYDVKELQQNTESMLLDLLALGLEPSKSTLFLQSLVPEHTELFWLFCCLTPYGDLTRQTQFKDKSDRIDTSTGKEYVSAGLFNYPVLQVADILIYRADSVPVGKDQEQHLELAREVARRFNMTYGDLFPEPKVLYTETPKIYSPADPDKKMSKSLGIKHCIGVFEEEKSIRKKIRSAVTDTGESMGDGQMSQGVANLFTLLRACGEDAAADNLTKDYETGTLRYVTLKDAVADALIELTTGFKERRAELNPDEALADVREMSEKARAIAIDTITQVRELMGLPKR